MTKAKPKKPRTKKVKTDTIQTVISTNQPLQLTLEQIILDDQIYDELTTVTFPNGQYTEINSHFRDTTIDEMIIDFSNFLVEYEKTGRVVTDKIVQEYLSLHIVLYFSKLVEKFPEDIYEKLDIFKKMLNNNYFKKVYKSFHENEINKVYEVMYKKLEDYQTLIKHDANLKKQLRDKVESMNLENQELIENVMFGDKDDKDGE